MGIIDIKDIEKAKLAIRKEPKPIIIAGQDELFNRKLLEYGKFDILLSPERGMRNDGIKWLSSGMNEIMGRIAKKNKIKIGINLKEIRCLEKKEKAVRIARIRQNIKLCRKTGVKMTVVGDCNTRNALGLLMSLGASSNQAKEAISF